jgi:RHS repeat-associated protein
MYDRWDRMMTFDPRGNTLYRYYQNPYKTDETFGYNDGSSITWQVLDALGSVRAEVDNTGNSLAEFEYSAFGNQVFTPPILTEGFEGTFLPAGWTNTGDVWVQDTHPNTGTYSALADRSVFMDGYLITPALDLSSIGSAILSYYIAPQDDPIYGGDFSVDVTNDGGASWIMIESYSQNSLGASGVFEQHSVDISAYSGMAIQVRFRAYNNLNATGVWLDDISIGEPAPDIDEYGYAGRVYDNESGLYYNRARMYDPEIGRFTTKDPLGMIDGPNMYTYVRNNPTNYVDPTGQFLVVVWGLVKLAAFVKDAYDCEKSCGSNQACQAKCMGNSLLEPIPFVDIIPNFIMSSGGGSGGGSSGGSIGSGNLPKIGENNTNIIADLSGYGFYSTIAVQSPANSDNFSILDCLNCGMDLECWAKCLIDNLEPGSFTNSGDISMSVYNHPPFPPAGGPWPPWDPFPFPPDWPNPLPPYPWPVPYPIPYLTNQAPANGVCPCINKSIYNAMGEENDGDWVD